MIRPSLTRLALAGAGIAAAAGIGVTAFASSGPAPVAATLTAAAPTATPSPSASHGATAGSPTKHAHHLLAGLRHRLVVATAAATGQTPKQVRAELRSGKSLDQIAGSKAASVKAAVTADVKALLDKAVADHTITQARENAILGRLGAEVEYEICHLLEKQGVT